MVKNCGPWVRTGKGSSQPSRGVVWAVCVLAALSIAAPASAQQTGQLTISLAVQSSISMVFNSVATDGAAGSGLCAFTSGNGTNTAVMALGTASFPSGTNSKPCIAMVKGFPTGAFYQVSSTFDVLVTKSNTTSASYNLQAHISTSPPANVTWLLNSQALTTTMAALTADTARNYGTAVSKTLQVQVKNTVAAGALTETITFLATAN